MESRVTPRTIHHVPDPSSVRDALGGLFSTPCVVEVVRTPAPRRPLGRRATDEVKLCVGIYANVSEIPATLYVLDFSFAAALAAGRSSKPLDLDEPPRAGVLPRALREHLYEVLNVLVGSVNNSNRPPLSLQKLEGPSDGIPDEFKKLFALAPGKLDLEVELRGVGRGQLSFRVS